MHKIKRIKSGLYIKEIQTSENRFFLIIYPEYQYIENKTIKNHTINVWLKFFIVRHIYSNVKTQPYDILTKQVCCLMLVLLSLIQGL